MSTTPETATLWNSLEIAKLVMSGITPIIVAYIAFRLNKISRKLDIHLWRNQKIIEKRIEIYDLIVPILNDFLCFYCFIGNWKDIKPSQIIEQKRILDKYVHIYAPLFDEAFLDRYTEFINLCFETFTGWGQDAKIKSVFERRKEAFRKRWDKEEEKHFSVLNTPHVQIREKYIELMNVLKNNIEIMNKGVYKKSDIPILNVK